MLIKRKLELPSALMKGFEETPKPGAPIES